MKKKKLCFIVYRFAIFTFFDPLFRLVFCNAILNNNKKFLTQKNKICSVFILELIKTKADRILLTFRNLDRAFINVLPITFNSSADMNIHAFLLH